MTTRTKRYVTRKMLKGIGLPIVVRYKPTGAIEVIEYTATLPDYYELIVSHTATSLILNDRGILHPVHDLNESIARRLRQIDR